jgi:transposase InsO family protein
LASFVTLSHPGIQRTHDTIKINYYHQQLRETVENIVGACETCQRDKLPGRGYGELAPPDVHIAPWFEVACNLIGPWRIEIQGNLFIFQALTIIDQVTNYCEIIQIPDKSSVSVARAFENSWLARYPRPMKVIHNQGIEFLGRPFEQMLTNAGIRPHATGVRNPRANAIVERLHQTICSSLRTRLRDRPPTNLETAQQYIDECLATAAYAL